MPESNDKELEHADEILKGPYEPCEVCEGTGRIPGDQALHGSCAECRGIGKHFRYYWFKAIQALGLDDLKQEVMERHREYVKQVGLEEQLHSINHWAQQTTNTFVSRPLTGFTRLKPIINIPIQRSTPLQIKFPSSTQKKSGNND